jgi:hypothetical protein
MIGPLDNNLNSNVLAGHDFRLSVDNAREIGVRLPVREFL